MIHLRWRPVWQLPGIRTHLVAFDTSVVDLTADVADPVELLMKVQLGGGTNIASAVEYGRQLIEQPAKSVIILVSDFYEGGFIIIADASGEKVCPERHQSAGAGSARQHRNALL